MTVPGQQAAVREVADGVPGPGIAGDKTRAAGTRELVRRQLLTVDREGLPDIPGRVFDRQRYRNRYKVTLPAPALLPKTPDSPVGGTDT